MPAVKASKRKDEPAEKVDNKSEGTKATASSDGQVNDNVIPVKPDYTGCGDEFDYEDDEDDDEDEVLDDIEYEKKKESALKSGRRVQVVADNFELDPNWVAPSYPKTAAEETLLTKALLRSLLFNNIGSDNFKKLIGAFERKEVAQRQTVIVEGTEIKSSEPGLFVLEKGSLAAYKQDGLAKRKKVKDYKTPGDFFGELALLYNNPRATTILATKKSVVWSITREVFNILVKQTAASDKSQLEEFLSKVEILKGFTEPERSKLADAMSLRNYDIGSKIISEGDMGEEFFIIKTGKCVVQKETRVIALYGPTNFFGELALLNNEPRQASVIAVSNVEVMVLPRSSFKKLLHVESLFGGGQSNYPERAVSIIGPVFGEGGYVEAEESDDESDASAESIDQAELQRRQKLMSNRGARCSVIGERFVVTENYLPPEYPKTPEQRATLENVLAKSFIFSQLRPADMSNVIGAFQEHRVKKDVVVIIQGSEVSAKDAGLYVIESGSLDVYKGGHAPDKLMEPSKVVRSRGSWCLNCKVDTDMDFSHYGPKVFTYTDPGQNFGELALLYNAPRAATVVTASDCVLWSITRDVFNNCVKNAMVKEKELQELCLSKVELLQKLRENEINKIVDALKPQTWQEGEHIITSGEDGNEFYILEDGEAYASINGVTVKEYKPSDYFGERALVKNEPRAADVIAKTDVRVLSLDRACFNRILGPLETIMQERIAEYKPAGQ